MIRRRAVYLHRIWILSSRRVSKKIYNSTQLTDRRFFFSLICCIRLHSHEIDMRRLEVQKNKIIIPPSSYSTFSSQFYCWFMCSRDVEQNVLMDALNFGWQRRRKRDIVIANFTCLRSPEVRRVIYDKVQIDFIHGFGAEY